MLLGTSEHIGEMICQTIENKKIDFLVIGRRGMSKLSRIFVGSTSKYCVEHADCNVLVVKGEWGPAEEHTNIDEVTRMEEEERQRRIVEEDEKHTIEHIQMKKEHNSETSK